MDAAADIERRYQRGLLAPLAVAAALLIVAGIIRVTTQLAGPVRELELAAADYAWLLGVGTLVFGVVAATSWMTVSEWRRDDGEGFPAPVGLAWICAYVELVAAVALLVVVALLG